MVRAARTCTACGRCSLRTLVTFCRLDLLCDGALRVGAEASEIRCNDGSEADPARTSTDKGVGCLQRGNGDTGSCTRRRGRGPKCTGRIADSWWAVNRPLAQAPSALRLACYPLPPTHTPPRHFSALNCHHRPYHSHTINACPRMASGSSRSPRAKHQLTLLLKARTPLLQRHQREHVT